MKADVTTVMVEEHKLILRMIDLVEKNTRLLEQGRFDDWRFYLDAVDFIRNYADRFHHAKEEATLFTALVANGMPEQNSPVAAMLMEHDQGRAFVRGMEAAAQKALDGATDQVAVLAENAYGYVELLRRHIEKEDTILYPLAERVLPAEVRPAMLEAYHRAEAEVAEDFSERYRRMVEDYEVRSAA
ncbi:hemerythrin-like domain-containing protein [Geothermobacter ehrlichii]|uniref:Hemerythrin-like domain-containing protein n=1 Tax=Geothermobacter ehrlichii TaxID=213224 RepID=A0A5D3WKG4_9BACT|nr:hemerythrin domain-containing protein [Geothermobacter ehrlichii]TYO98878.1 hemerythrin-like domain-containing protein [Geothermobacter ehrlichii]